MYSVLLKDKNIIGNRGKQFICAIFEVNCPQLLRNVLQGLTHCDSSKTRSFVLRNK